MGLRRRQPAPWPAPDPALRVELPAPAALDEGPATEPGAVVTPRRIAIFVGLVYYVSSLIVFRDVLFAIPSVLRGDAVIVGDELVPFFNPTSQLFEQAKGDFNQLTHGYEFRVRYSFLTTWVRHYKVLPFAILFVLPSVFWAVYLTTARFIDRVFTSLSSQSIYLATAFPTTLIYLIMTYAKVTHFYTLIVGLAMMTISSQWMLYGILFKERKWKRYMVLSSVVSLLNPAIHYLILFMLFFSLTVLTLALGELARWIRRGGPQRALRIPRTLLQLIRRPARRRKLRYLRRGLLDSTLGRCAVSGVIFLFITLLPYALFVKFIALRGVPNLSETVPGDYYFIRDASVSWLHIASWDLAGITDKILFGDYLAKVPRYPNIAYSFLLLVPLVVPHVRRRLFVTRQHRQLLGVVYVSIAFAVWATIGYAEPTWFPTFHRAMAGVTRTAHATDTPVGDLTLALTSTVVQVLRFPHRFQLILFMLAPFVMSLSLAFGIDAVTRRWMATAQPGKIWKQRTADDDREVTPRAALAIRLLATAFVASVFFSPFWSNAPYRKVFSSGDFGSFMAPYPTDDLAEVKEALLTYPDGKTVVLPPTETAKLVTDSNGVDHKFIDKFFIYYLDQPSYYYGLTGDTTNKFEFFLMLRGIYYQQDWWVNIARDVNVEYIIMNKLLRDNRGVGAEYLPNVENYVEPALERRDEDFALRFENDTYALYQLTDTPNEEREKLLIDSSWSSYLDLVFTRLDLSRCYDFEYLPYYQPSAEGEEERINLFTDDAAAAAIDLYLLDHPELIAKPDTKIFAFNPDIVASSYYLSPMFRSFLFFSNTKWNRTEVITPGVFGSLRGSFIGVPRATRFDIPVAVTEPGRYRLLMRTAATANDISVTAKSVGYEESFEMRSPADNLQMFDIDEVYLQDRQPIDTSAMSVEELETSIGDELVPVNLSFAYQDLGVVDLPVGVHKFAVEKSDTNPMLVEGLMLVPEDDYETMALSPEVEVVTDPNELDCSERSEVAGEDDLYVDPAANAVHENLSQEELRILAAAGVEDLIPDNSGGIGRNWLSLLMTGGILTAAAWVVRWRSRAEVEDDQDTEAEGPDDDEPDDDEPVDQESDDEEVTQ